MYSHVIHIVQCSYIKFYNIDNIRNSFFEGYKGKKEGKSSNFRSFIINLTAEIAKKQSGFYSKCSPKHRQLGLHWGAPQIP